MIGHSVRNRNVSVCV